MWVYCPFTRRSTARITLIPFYPRATLPISLSRLIKQIYKFPQSSLAELARNSVVQSGFEMEVKRHWLGQHWYLPGDAGNEINKVGFALPSIRNVSGYLSYFGRVHFVKADYDR